ncbi:MAG: PAS domain S-box protein, partial [Bacteroidota bacterium]
MNCIHNQILNKVVFGYAHLKILLDKYNEPVDYEFIEVNHAFLSLAGLSGKQVKGKKVSEVIHGYTKDETNWIQFFGNTALNLQDDEYEYFSEVLNKWFRVQVFSTEKEYFTMTFFDVTEEKFLFDSIKSSFVNDALNPDYKRICHDMKDISGARYVALNIMDFLGKTFQTVAIAGLKKDIEKVSGLLGFEPEGKKWDHDQDRFENLHARTISKYESLMELTNQRLNTNLINKIINAVGVGEVYLVSIKKNAKVSGDFTLMMKPGEKLKNQKLIELQAWQAALQLDYYRTKQMLNQLFVVSPDLIAVTDVYGHFLRINDAWQDFLGKDRDALIGRKFSEFVHPDDMSETQKAMKTLAHDAKLSGFVNRYIDKNNQFRYIEWRATYYENLVYAAARDITENIESRQRLQEKSDLQEIL